jgi:hypothetical protein
MALDMAMELRSVLFVLCEVGDDARTVRGDRIGDSKRIAHSVRRETFESFCRQSGSNDIVHKIHVAYQAAAGCVSGVVRVG